MDMDATKTQDFISRLSADPSVLYRDAKQSRETLLAILQSTFSSCKSATCKVNRILNF